MTNIAPQHAALVANEPAVVAAATAVAKSEKEATTANTEAAKAKAELAEAEQAYALVASPANWDRVTAARTSVDQTATRVRALQSALATARSSHATAVRKALESKQQTLRAKSDASAWLERVSTPLQIIAACVVEIDRAYDQILATADEFNTNHEQANAAAVALGLPSPSAPVQPLARVNETLLRAIWFARKLGRTAETPSSRPISFGLLAIGESRRVEMFSPEFPGSGTGVQTHSAQLGAIVQAALDANNPSNKAA